MTKGCNADSEATQTVIGSTEELKQSILKLYHWMNENPNQMPDFNKFFDIKMQTTETLGDNITEHPDLNS